jgi:hypothetical protein
MDGSVLLVYPEEARITTLVETLGLSNFNSLANQLDIHLICQKKFGLQQFDKITWQK